MVEKKIWCNLEKSCDKLICCNSLGFVSGSWILLSLIDFHLSARVDDFLVPRSVQFLWTLQLVKMCGIFAVFGLPENSSKFRNEILRYIFNKSFPFLLSFLINSTLKSQKDEKGFSFWDFKHDDKGTVIY